MGERGRLPFTDDDEWPWRWMVTPSWGALHRVRSGRKMRDGRIGVIGETVCGVRAALFMPGVLSRVARPRCKRCCRKLGILQGNGAPYNSGIQEPARQPPNTQRERDDG